MNAESPIISVILPSLNVAGYIEECLAGVAGQTLTDIEMICVDAGSSDGTLEIIRKYADQDSRVTVLTSEKKSYGYQVNLGLAHAKGQYVGIIDTDDFVDIHMYERLYDLALKTRIPDYVKCNYYRTVEFHGQQMSWTELFGTDRINERIDLKSERKMSLSVNSGLWAGIYRRAFLQDNQVVLNESPGASYQDIGFNAQVKMLAESAAFTDEPLYYYRIDNYSASVRNTKLWHAVTEEWKYAKDKLLQATGDNKLFEGYTGKMVQSYGWNFGRLVGTEYQARFLDEIYEELLEIKNNQSIFDELTTYEKENLQMLLNRDYSSSEKALEEGRKIKSLLMNEDYHYVLLPAGARSERLIFLQNLLGKRAIIALCDNSDQKSSASVEGYTVYSVEGAVKKYGSAADIKWIITSKYHFEELKDQLIQAGVPDGNIIVMDSVPGREEAIELADGE